jgi:hypothetical protein
MGVGGQYHFPSALLPGKKPGTNYAGGCVGPMNVLGGCGKSCHAGIRFSYLQARSRVTIPSTLLRQLSHYRTCLFAVRQKFDSDTDMLFLHNYHKTAEIPSFISRAYHVI